MDEGLLILILDWAAARPVRAAAARKEQIPEACILKILGDMERRDLKTKKARNSSRGTLPFKQPPSVQQPPPSPSPAIWL